MKKVLIGLVATLVVASGVSFAIHNGSNQNQGEQRNVQEVMTPTPYAEGPATAEELAPIGIRIRPTGQEPRMTKEEVIEKALFAYFEAPPQKPRTRVFTSVHAEFGLVSITHGGFDVVDRPAWVVTIRGVPFQVPSGAYAKWTGKVPSPTSTVVGVRDDETGCTLGGAVITPYTVIPSAATPTIVTQEGGLTTPTPMPVCAPGSAKEGEPTPTPAPYGYVRPSYPAPMLPPLYVEYVPLPAGTMEVKAPGPVAYLANPPAELTESIGLFAPPRNSWRCPDFIEEFAILACVLYEGDGHKVGVSTVEFSPAAKEAYAQGKVLLGDESITLADGTPAWFSEHKPDECWDWPPPNQVAWQEGDLFICVASDLPRKDVEALATQVVLNLGSPE